MRSCAAPQPRIKGQRYFWKSLFGGTNAKFFRKRLAENISKNSHKLRRSTDCRVRDVSSGDCNRGQPHDGRNHPRAPWKRFSLFPLSYSVFCCPVFIFKGGIRTRNMTAPAWRPGYSWRFSVSNTTARTDWALSISLICTRLFYQYFYWNTTSHYNKIFQNSLK